MQANAVLELDQDGAQLVPNALSPDQLFSLAAALKPYDVGRAGARLSNLDGLRSWLESNGTIGRIAAKWLGPTVAPVRAILFDKNSTSNWTLGWHQDRTIAVNARYDLPGFNNWSRKHEIDHVEPPFELIERLLTIRIHLDPVPHDNAPLLVSPGTHRLGKIAENDLAETVKLHGIYECIADAGDVWVYRTAIVHASKRSTSLSRRRVLQVDYCADPLPDPLQWKLAQVS